MESCPRAIFPAMSEFANVTVVKAANIYFDGKVTSRTIKFGNGTTKTLGIMMTGDYEFNTSEKELMEIQYHLFLILLVNTISPCLPTT